MHELMTVDEVVSYLRISRDKFYRLRAKGNAPKGINLGGRIVRYRLSDVDKWLDEHK